ncbi:MAG: hypothetical protein O3A00_12195 [Planctomycetota bacterium]|nr:hypothetical protein [Planctomycetota bacterium]
MTESAPIHQLYCTHCTYGSSYLHQRDGEVKNQAFEYSTRAGSVKREECHDVFRRFESYLYYHQPADTTPDKLLKHTAFDSPLRMVFFPHIQDKQVLMQVCYRQTDTQGRPGSYFAHLLVSEAGDEIRQLNAADCLKTWGTANWVLQDNPDFPFQLPGFKSLDDFCGGRPAAVSDKLLTSFLTADPAQGESFADPAQIIPERWNATTPTERQELMVDVLQSFLQLDLAKRQTVLVGAEPSLAALLFYGVARLLPTRGVGQQISFSTFESQFDRSQTALAATCTRAEGKLELGREANTPRGFTINSFLPASQRPSLRWKHDAKPHTYARMMVDMLVDKGLREVLKLVKRLEKVGDLQGHELDEALRAELLIERLIDPLAKATAAEVDALESQTVQNYVRQSVGRLLARQTQRLSGGDEPESEPEIEEPTEPQPAQTGALPLGAIPPPSGLLPPPPPPPAIRPAKKETPAPKTTASSSSLSKMVSKNRDWGIEILTILGADADVPAVVKETRFIRLLADEVLKREPDPTTGAKKTPYTALIASPRFAFPHRLTMLIAYCDRFSGQLPPDQAAAIWARRDARSRESDPALLDALFRELDDGTLTALLSDQLDTLPVDDAGDRFLPILQSVIPACQADAGKQGLLVEVVNHKRVTANVLFSALRSDSTGVRDAFFKLYPSDLPPLKDYIRELLGQLPTDPEFAKSLNLLTIAKPILDTVDQEYVAHWETIRRHLMTIKNLVPKETGLFARFKKEQDSTPELNRVGEQLADIAGRLLIDEYYPDDIQVGRQRAHLIAAIANRVPGEGGLPHKIVDALQSHFAGRGWKEIAGRVTPARSNRFDVGKLASRKPITVAAVLLVACVVWSVMSGGRQSVLNQLVALESEPRAERFATIGDDEFKELIGDPETAAVDELFGEFTTTLGEQEWNGMPQSRRSAILRRVPNPVALAIIQKLRSDHRAVHLVSMPARRFTAITDDLENAAFTKLLDGFSSVQVHKRLETLDAKPQLRLLSALSDQQLRLLGTDHFDELNRESLNEWLVGLPTERLLMIGASLGESHVGKLTKASLDRLLTSGNVAVLSHVIPLMKSSQIAAVQSEHLVVLDDIQAGSLFSKLDAEARKEIEAKWQSIPKPLKDLDEPALHALSKAELATHGVPDIQSVLGKLTVDQLMALDPKHWAGFNETDVKAIVSKLNATQFSAIAAAVDPQRLMFAMLAANAEQLATIEDRRLDQLDPGQLTMLAEKLGKNAQAIFTRVKPERLQSLTDAQKALLLSKLEITADSPLAEPLAVATKPIPPKANPDAKRIKPTWETTPSGLNVAYLKLPKYPQSPDEVDQAELEIELPEAGYDRFELHGFRDLVVQVGKSHRVTMSKAALAAELTLKASHVQGDGNRDELMCSFKMSGEKMLQFKWQKLTHGAAEHLAHSVRYCVLELTKRDGKPLYLSLSIPTAIDPVQLDMNGKSPLSTLDVAPAGLSVPLIIPIGKLHLGGDEGSIDFQGPLDEDHCPLEAIYAAFNLQYSSLKIDQRSLVTGGDIIELVWTVKVKADPDLDKKLQALEDKRTAADDYIRTIKSKTATPGQQEAAARKLATAVEIPYREPKDAVPAYVRWVNGTLIPKGTQLKKDLDQSKTALLRSAEREANELQQRQPFISGTVYRLVGALEEEGGHFKGGVAVPAFEIPLPPPPPKDSPKTKEKTQPKSPE